MKNIRIKSTTIILIIVLSLMKVAYNDFSWEQLIILFIFWLGWDIIASLRRSHKLNKDKK